LVAQVQRRERRLEEIKYKLNFASVSYVMDNTCIYLSIEEPNIYIRKIYKKNP
jgi:hypothetical protein